MTDRKRKHDETRIVNFADHSEIADAVSPKPGQVSSQSLAKMPRIFAAFDSVVEPVNDTGRNRPVELRKLLLSERRDFNRPGQAPS